MGSGEPSFLSACAPQRARQQTLPVTRWTRASSPTPRPPSLEVASSSFHFLLKLSSGLSSHGDPPFEGSSEFVHLSPLTCWRPSHRIGRDTSHHRPLKCPSRLFPGSAAAPAASHPSASPQRPPPPRAPPSGPSLPGVIFRHSLPQAQDALGVFLPRERACRHLVRGLTEVGAGLAHGHCP